MPLHWRILRPTGWSARAVQWFEAPRVPSKRAWPARCAGFRMGSSIRPGSASMRMSMPAAAMKSPSSTIAGHQHDRAFHLCRADGAGGANGRCPARPRSRARRSRHHIHADGSGSRDRHACLRAARRDPFGRVRRFAARELALRIDDAKPKALLTASCGIEFERAFLTSR